MDTSRKAGAHRKFSWFELKLLRLQGICQGWYLEFLFIGALVSILAIMVLPFFSGGK